MRVVTAINQESRGSGWPGPTDDPVPAPPADVGGGSIFRLLPKIFFNALAIVKPDTIVRWHRAGFRSYWRWKSRPRGGRPTVPLEIRELIREMSIANPLWGAPRIHGELLKLGIEIGQTSVAKYMARREARRRKVGRRSSAIMPTASRRWTFRRTDDLISLALWLVNHGAWSTTDFVARRHSTSDRGMNRKSTHEACGWEQAPRYLIRDRDRAYGEVFIRRLRSMGIRDRPTSPRSPWQNGYAERLIGSIPRECVDHAAGYLGMSLEVLLNTYGHHHPDYLSDAVEKIAIRECGERKAQVSGAADPAPPNKIE